MQWEESCIRGTRKTFLGKWRQLMRGGAALEGGLCPKTEGILSQRQRQYAISSWNLWRTPIPPTVANPQQQFTSPGIAAIRNSAHARACTIPLTTLKVFWKKGEGGFCNPTSYRDCRIFVIFWDLTRQDMCIRRTRRNMWMRWKVEHWSSNRFDASWCFPNLRHKFCKKIFASQQSISVTFGVGLYAMLCQPHFDGIGFHTFCYLQQKNMPIDFLHYSALYVMRPHSTTWLLRLLPPTATAADILNKDVPSCEWKDLLPQVACISRHIFTLIAFVSLLSDILNKDVPAPHWKVLLLTSANKQSWQANPVRKHKSLKSVFLASLFSVLFPFSFHCQSQPSSIKSSHLAFGNNLFHWGLYWTLCIV